MCHLRMKCSTYDSIPTNVIRVTIFPFLKKVELPHILQGKKKIVLR